MTDITSHIQSKVTTDGARSRVRGLGGSQQLTAFGNSIQTLPYHPYHRARVLIGGEEEGGGRVRRRGEEEEKEEEEEEEEEE